MPETKIVWIFLRAGDCPGNQENSEMNYIEKLQKENESLKKQVQFFQDALNNFHLFLHSPKFTGEENGERKDWISTGDVINWKRDVETDFFRNFN